MTNLKRKLNAPFMIASKKDKVLGNKPNQEVEILIDRKLLNIAEKIEEDTKKW